jgi:biopolymer transport protein ExbB
METAIEAIKNGGVLIYPLTAMLIVSLVIIFLKWNALRTSNVINPKMLERIEKILLEGKIPEAMAYCKQHPIPMTNIILSGIVNFQKPVSELKEILEETGRQQIPLVRRYMTLLGTIASVAPLMGLFGTVLGMISVFTELGTQTTVAANMLAGGISEALVTTAFGMVIAMISLTFYNHFTTRINNFILDMERHSLHLVAVLKRLDN